MGKLLQDFQDIVQRSSLPDVFAKQQKYDPLNAKLEKNLLPGFNKLAAKPTEGAVGAFVAPQAAPAPAPATLITPTEMPSIDSADALEAKRRAMAQQLSRGGRASTILTDSLG